MDSDTRSDTRSDTGNGARSTIRRVGVRSGRSVIALHTAPRRIPVLEICRIETPVNNAVLPFCTSAGVRDVVGLRMRRLVFGAGRWMLRQMFPFRCAVMCW